MPRRRVVWSGRKQGRGIPPGVRAAVLADQLSGQRSHAETARSYGIDPLTVKRLANELNGINVEDVQCIQHGLPRLFAVLAARHAVEALERVHTDPATAVKSTFGAKLAVEAGRLTAPAADNPGAVMWTFIQTMNVGAGASPALTIPVIEGTAERGPEAPAPAPDGPWPGAGES